MDEGSERIMEEIKKKEGRKIKFKDLDLILKLVAITILFQFGLYVYILFQLLGVIFNG